MIRVTYEQGNGYRCSCCRRTWTETEDFNTREEVLAFLVEKEAARKISIYEDEGDFELICIEEQIGVDIKKEFSVDPKKVEAEINRRQQEKDQKKKKEEAKEKRAKIQREKQLLKELVEKYGKE